jgi:hypothetical protein
MFVTAIAIEETVIVQNSGKMLTEITKYVF